VPVRMRDIADILGISQTTVSHVLRGRGEEFRIGAATAQRVREAATRLGYFPSALSRNFKAHRAHAVGLAVGDVSNPFWASLAIGAQKEVESRGYAMVLTHTGESVETERKIIDLLRERRVDGLILSPSHLKPRHLGVLHREELPFVLVDRAIKDLDVPSVITDSIAGMRMAVDHLVAQGHRRIAYLGGPVSISTFRDRRDGLRRALAAHGLRPGPMAAAPSDPVAAQEAARQLFRGRDKATAVIGANFWLTVGLLRQVPPNVTVVGFDDLFLADILNRPVTTIAQPVEELGRQAARLLFQEITKLGSAKRRVVLAPSLVVRGPTSRLA
jgi:LacI family transcriptional regulator